MDIAKGKFERTDAENYDELLKALDVNFLLRKAATASTPVMEVSILKLRYFCHDRKIQFPQNLWNMPKSFDLTIILGD